MPKRQRGDEDIDVDSHIQYKRTVSSRNVTLSISTTVQGVIAGIEPLIEDNSSVEQIPRSETFTRPWRRDPPATELPSMPRHSAHTGGELTPTWFERPLVDDHDFRVVEELEGLIQEEEVQVMV